MNDRHLIASEGMMLFNGEAYAVEVWLGDWNSPDNWWEITYEEYASIQETQITEII